MSATCMNDCSSVSESERAEAVSELFAGSQPAQCEPERKLKGIRGVC
jgi:hypothetical protein